MDEPRMREGRETYGDAPVDPLRNYPDTDPDMIQAPRENLI